MTTALAAIDKKGLHGGHVYTLLCADPYVTWLTRLPFTGRAAQPNCSPSYTAHKQKGPQR